MNTTNEQHANNIRNLVGDQDFIWTFPGQGDLAVEVDGQKVYRIRNAHAQGIRPETLTPAIWG